MVASEAFHHHAGKVPFLAHEHTLVGNKHVVENDQRLVASELRVAQVHVGVFLQFAGIARLATVNHEHAFSIGRNGKRNGIVLVGFLHGHGRHDEVLVRVDGSRLVGLSSAHHNAIGTHFHDVEIEVGVGLLRGTQRAVALGVGHGTVNSQVVVLNHFQIFSEALVIFSAIFLIDFKSRGIDGVESIHSHTALEASCRLLSTEALHLHLLD